MSKKRILKRTVSILSAIAMIGGVLSLPTAQSKESCGGQVRQEGKWTTVLAPEYPDAKIHPTTVAASDPANARRLFMSDGKSLMRTEDGGCKWTEVWTVPSADSDEQYRGFIQRPLLRIQAIAIPRAAPQRVYVGVGTSNYFTPTFCLQCTDLSVPEFHVLRSDKGGDKDSWVLAEGGLPPFSATQNNNQPIINDLEISPSNAARVYLIAGSVLYSTSDSGNTWAEVNPVTDPAATAERVAQGRGLCAGCKMTVDPDRPSDLWIYTGSFVYRSSDGGKTLIPVPFGSTGTGSVGAHEVRIHRAGGGPATVVVASYGACPVVAISCLFISKEGGKSGWFAVRPPRRFSYADAGQVYQQVMTIDFLSGHSLIATTVRGQPWVLNLKTEKWRYVGASHFQSYFERPPRQVTVANDSKSTSAWTTYSYEIYHGRG